MIDETGKSKLTKGDKGKQTLGQTMLSQIKELQTPPICELLSRLGSSQNGLGNAEAQNRLAQYGYNELAEKKVNPVLKFLSYFCGPIPAMILIAAILSVVLRHWQRGFSSSASNIGETL